MTPGRKILNQLERMRAEARLLARALRLWRAPGPRVLFFPSDRPEGASLLRAWLMAEALGAFGWQAAAVPPILKRGGRRRVVRLFRPDLLVFQQCRHALNDGAQAFGRPYVLDTDDADFYLTVPGLAERLERTSRGARGVIAGSRFLRDWHAGRNPRTGIIWTGTPISDGRRPPHAERAPDGVPVLAWAQAKPLTYTEELAFVLDLARRLQRRGTGFRLRFYGIATEDEARALRDRIPAGIPVELIAPLSYPEFLVSLREVAVGLSPIIASSPFSRGKSFGKILGYLDARVPVITSDEADHALFFTPETGVVSNDPDRWETEAARLLASPAARDAMSAAAFETFTRELSLTAAAAKTDRVLRALL